MKHYFSLIFFLLILFMLNGCATKPDNSGEVQNIQSSASIKNKKQNTEKLRFDDWKYKGFGQELPFWIEIAIDSDIVTLKKSLPELYNVSAVTVISGFGENADQAEQAAKSKAEQITEQDGYKFYDSFWVRESISEKNNTMPYRAIYIYYKD